MLWQVLGNYWYYKADCPDTAPHLCTLVLWMLVLGYVFFMSPCLCCCGVIICLPVIILVVRNFHIVLSEGATDLQVQKLVERRAYVEDSECPICAEAFDPTQMHYQMPCDER